jgi:hypothetical protein
MAADHKSAIGLVEAVGSRAVRHLLTVAELDPGFRRKHQNVAAPDGPKTGPRDNLDGCAVHVDQGSIDEVNVSHRFLEELNGRVE